MIDPSWLSTIVAASATAILTVSSVRSQKYHDRIDQYLLLPKKISFYSQAFNSIMTKLPNRAALSAKLIITNSQLSLRELRFKQISYAAIGFLIAIILNLITLNEPVFWLKLAIPVFAFAGWQLPASQLSAQYQKIRDDLDYGFAEVVDLIALAVTAGNSLNAALIQTSEIVSSSWQQQLIAIRLDLISGLSVISSLQRADARLNHPTFHKFIAAILLTLERGTPLASQLRIQSAEITEQLRRDLMVKAGKKDAIMLLPVVFLILPIIVITTLFPGILALGKLI